MTLFLLLPALGLLALFALPYYWMKLSRAARLTAHLPGPTPYPFIGNSLELGSGPVDFLKNLKRLRNEYGSLFKLWLGSYLYVVVGDAKHVAPFLSSTTNISKNIAYKFGRPWVGTGLLTSSGNKWKRHRKIITQAFNYTVLEGFMDIFNANGNILIQKLKKNAGGKEFDICQYISLCTLDIINESAMGIQKNMQDNNESVYVSSMRRLQKIIIRRVFSPWLFTDFIFNLSQSGQRQKECLKIVHAATEEIIAKRKQELFKKKSEESDYTNENEYNQKRKLAFLDLLLQHTSNGAMTDEEIREEVDTFMFAGHETTSAAVCFCLWSLATHQECQEKVYKELHEIFGDFDRDTTSNDLHKMKYLERVIKESQRYYATVPFFFRELDEDVKIDGLHFVRGTNIMIAPFLMNNDPEYFPEPEKFDPERFSSENALGRNPYAYVPFSAGPRNCIGQKFAVMEMKCIISKVLRKFKLHPGTKEIILSGELVMKSSNGIFIKLENRK